ncbi:porin [uncultured Methylibium sp.]|uniref:porin n=1 Tax=uncultured Methylibium sp. TaxID=381093 RepID=UPI0025F684CD|nr:porin [uncultured Methylibium sp.]
MKKSIIALAALGAFAGAASAQSSVTLYGRVDSNVAYTTPGSNVNRGDGVWALNEGGSRTGAGGSRWGLRGSEDLGGGLSAYFQLENGFDADTGASTAGVQFGRTALVALRSVSLGDVRFGRQDTFSRLMNVNFSDSTGLGEMKIDEAVGAGSGRPLFQSYGQRVNNAVQYISPNLSGFQLAAMIGAGEGATARYQGAMASYRQGPLAVALSYEAYDSFGTRTSAFNDLIHIGANYNFGFATVYAAYQTTSDFGANLGAASPIRDYDAYNVAVMVPFGAFSLRAQYTGAKYDLVAGGSQDASKYGVSARYQLSKRTMLYSAITQRSGDGKENFAVKRDITLLGLAHNF